MTNALARRGSRALHRTGPWPRAAGAAALVLSALALSACGGGGVGGRTATKSQATTTAAATNGSTTTSAATTHAAGGPGGASGAAFAGPAASGTIASISGDTLEVQNAQSGQTTVDVTAKTRISATTDVTLAAVEPGDCLTASGTKSSGSGLAATSVALVGATGGSCTAFGQGGAQRGGRFGFERSRSGTFTRPTGSGGSSPARPVDVRTVTGTVKSVSGSTIEVSGFLRSFRFSPGAATSSSTSTTRPAATMIAVTVGRSTRYEKLGTATFASLKVGECATAFGTANDIGAVTADRLSVTPATGGSCGSGLAGGGGGGFFGGRYPGAGAGVATPGAPAATGSLVSPGAAS